MTDVVLNILALVAGGVTLQLFADARVVREEEATGLALGPDSFNGTDEYQCGNPS